MTASHENVWTWSVATGRRERDPHGSFSGVSSASFSPDGRWVVAAARKVALFFRADTADQVSYRRRHADRGARGHTTWLTAATFAPDGRRILTSSGDGTVRIYDCEVCGSLDDLLALATARLATSRR